MLWLVHKYRNIAIGKSERLENCERRKETENWERRKRDGENYIIVVNRRLTKNTIIPVAAYLCPICYNFSMHCNSILYWLPVTGITIILFAFRKHRQSIYTAKLPWPVLYKAGLQMRLWPINLLLSQRTSSRFSQMRKNL